MGLGLDQPRPLGEALGVFAVVGQGQLHGTLEVIGPRGQVTGRVALVVASPLAIELLEERERVGAEPGPDQLVGRVELSPREALGAEHHEGRQAGH